MKKTFLKLATYATMIAVAALTFTSCSEDSADDTNIEVGGDSDSDDSDDSDDNTSDDTAKTAELVGDITSDMVLDSSVAYTITGPVNVKSGASLTIPAGMVIEAVADFSSYILVECGGQIFAEGTADAPITFTSSSDANWGGLVINGYAPVSGVNESGNTGSTEISSEIPYGGDDAADNSGVLTYIKLLKTGAQADAGTEHNGLTLNGVGNGTTIDHIFVDATADDGVEFFGGSVNVSNLLVVNSDDDMFDFTQGYTGTLSNCYGIWESAYTSGEDDPRGVEADGNLDGKTPDDYNQSNFKIEDMTIVVNTADFEMHDAIKVRRGATVTITNAVVKGSGTIADLIDFVDSKGDATEASTVSVTNLLSNEIADLLVSTEGTSYTVDYETTSNTGCDTSVFAWTGYDFE